MKHIIRVNVTLLGLFLVSYLLGLGHFPYLRMGIGLLLIWIPGLNIAWILEGLTRQRYGMLKLFLWSLAAAPILSAFAFAQVGQGYSGKINESIALIAILSLVIVTGMVALLVNRENKKLTLMSWEGIKELDQIFWLVGMIILIIFGVNFLLYRYIPEFDGYLYIGRLQGLVDAGYINQKMNRLYFYTYNLNLFYVTKISFYWIFKLIMPLGLSLIFLVFFYKAKSLKTSRVATVFISLAPFLFPVVIIEALYTRPQSFFTLGFVVILALLAEILVRERDSLYYYELFFILILSFLGYQIHEYFVFLIVITIASLIIFSWPYIKRFPFRSTMIGITGLGVGYIVLKQLNILGDLDKFTTPFWQVIIKPKFDLWFINNYRNITGTQMGWPGMTWLLYYAYNLGIVLPLVILWLLGRKRGKWIKESFTSNIPIWIGLIMFFLIAEIFPRIGVAYLPDRAWLFMTICLALLLPDIMKNFAFEKKKVLYGMVILFMISFIASWFIVYAKGGWTTPKEYLAARFIKDNISPDAFVISQHSNNPMIQYFGKRTFLEAPKDFFMGDKIDKVYLEELVNKETAISKALKKYKIQLGYYYFSLFKVTDPNQKNIYIDNYAQIGKNYVYLETQLKMMQQNKIYKWKPIYIVYSKEKFSSLYGKRQWWKKANLYGADLEKFDQNKTLFTKIYNKDGIMIWKVEVDTLR